MSIPRLLLALTLAGAGGLRFERRSGPAAGGAVLDVGAPGAFDAKWTAAPSVLHVGGRFRMWYSSLYDSQMGPGGIGVASSSDGIAWTRDNGGRPVLGLGPPGAFDDGQVGFPDVLYDGSLYRMWYAGMPVTFHASGFGYYRIGLATSRDGIHWRRENGGRPVLDLGPPGAADEVQVGSTAVLREAGGYRMWYAAWSPLRSHRILTGRSPDGIQWVRDLGGEPVSGLDPGEAYAPAVCRAGGGYLMLFMALRAERALYGARSADGLTWTMIGGGRPVIAPGAVPAFDADYAGHACLLRLGSTLRVWYTGYRREPGGVRGWKLRIGLAEARLAADE